MTSNSQPLPPIEFIDVKTDYKLYKEDYDAALKAVIEKGCFILGPPLKELETTLAEYVGVKHCITVGNGTESLQIALMALGVGRGDEVITVPFTWISTSEAVDLVGATPVFIDVDPKTFNIDIGQLEAAITSKTKAIIPVSLFGQMPNLEKIMEIAKKHNVAVIEDAAQSFGATQHGKRSCSMATISSTSFYPAKPLGCWGEGGALFTNDDELARKIRALRTHGGEVRHVHTVIGMNGRFDTLQAAVLNVKMKHFPQWVEDRWRIGNRLSQLIRDAGISEFIVPPPVEEGNTHVYAIYTIKTSFRDHLETILKKNSIPYGVYYPKCVHLQPAYDYLHKGKGSFPVSEQLSDEVLSLPMHQYLKEEELQRIVEALKEACTTAEALGIRKPPTSNTTALNTTKPAAATQTSSNDQPPYVHPTAIVDANVTLGNGVKIWHFAHVMSNAVIGDQCSLGQNVFIAGGVKLGRNVRIQNNVSVYSGVEVDEDVFLGPSCVFTNDYLPRSGINKPYMTTKLRKGVTIGANVTVVCGHELGSYCMIGAGAVVTKDVKPYALMVGNPARQIGWVSRYGEKLSLPLSSSSPVIAQCSATGESYRLTGNQVEFVGK